MTRSAASALLILGAFVVISCTGPPAMTPVTAEELAERTADVRTAVESGDRAAAESALASLRSSVNALNRNDAISDDKMVEILGSANEVEATLDVMPTTTTTVPDDEGKGKGHGKFKDE